MEPKLVVNLNRLFLLTTTFVVLFGFKFAYIGDSTSDYITSSLLFGSAPIVCAILCYCFARFTNLFSYIFLTCYLVNTAAAFYMAGSLLIGDNLRDIFSLNTESFEMNALVIVMQFMYAKISLISIAVGTGLYLLSKLLKYLYQANFNR